MECSEGDVITETPFVGVGGDEVGTWSQLSGCKYNQVVCGVRAKVQPNQGSGDDTSLNRIALLCCPGEILTYMVASIIQVLP